MEERFLQNPNLPSAPVSLMMVSKRAARLLSGALNEYKINTLSPFPSETLDYRINDHPDLLACHMGGNHFIVSKGQNQELLARQYGIDAIVSNICMSSDHPGDVVLNAAVVGKIVFHNFEYTAPELLSVINALKLRLVSVKQGYSKCSTCVVGRRVMITEDISIHSEAIKAGFDSLLIEKGFVSLDGFPYGFIGGASGLIAPNRLTFTGRLDAHPQYQRILDFLRSYGVEPVFLTDRPVFDAGSLLPIKEYTL